MESPEEIPANTTAVIRSHGIGKEVYDCLLYTSIMLAFTNKEMSLFMSEVKQKKDPTKDDRMFGFGFDSSKAIYQTRGFREIRDMSQYLSLIHI